MSGRCLVVLLLGFLTARHAVQQALAAADAALEPRPLPSLERGSPPFMTALQLTALRDPPSMLGITSSDSSNTTASSSRPAARPSTSTLAAVSQRSGPAPLDALRPAAAAALARQHSDASAPLTDDDITAINILLGREPPASGAYMYDTGLPMTGSTPLPHLLAFGNRTVGPTTSSSSSSSSNHSSMQSGDRLSKLRSLGQPLSWLARTYAVTGGTLLKLRITQLLQLVLQDAISDSLASAANLPPQQAVIFASSNLSLPLAFTGVDWDDGAVKATGGQTHKGLLAVQKALQELTGDYDARHTLVSFDQLPQGPARSAAAAAAGKDAKQPAAATAGKETKQRAAARDAAAAAGANSAPATAAAAAGRVPPAAASSARKLLLKHHQQQQQRPPSATNSRRLSAEAAANGPASTKLVYVRLYGMDPMNLTTVMDKLGNCSALGMLEAGPQGGSQPDSLAAPLAGSPAARAAASAQASTAAATGRMPELPAGQPMRPLCVEVFRRHFEQQGVPVAPGSAFSVAPKDPPQANIGLSVAIGVTREQQVASDADRKASAWLNGTSMQDILGTFNLTVTSADSDYTAYLRDRDSGRFPSLPGLNLSSLLPGLFQTVLEVNRNLTQQQQQLQQQGGIVPGAPTALGRSILAGIIVAVVASVLALLGVVVLLLRRRGDRGGGSGDSGQQDDAGSGPAGSRRRKRRPRVYHNKYLPDGGPVLGHDPQPDASTAAATATDAPRYTLERGDSVMSQVNIEMDEAQEEDQDSQASFSTSAAAAAAPAAAAAAARSTGSRPQQQQQQQQQQKALLRRQLERQEGEAGSSSSINSRQQLLSGMQPSSSDASLAAGMEVAPADSSVWGDSTHGSVSGRTVSAATDLTAHSSVLSPWASHGEGQGAGPGAAAAPAAIEAKQGSKHRLAVASQAVQSPAAAAAAAGLGDKEGPGATQQGTADGSFSVASAFAAMDAQLDAAVRAGASSSRGSSGGGSAKAVQPLGSSCWHKDGHVSGFLVPEAAAGGGGGTRSSSAGGAAQQQAAGRRAGGRLVSPFAAAIQLAHSVASDEV